MHYICPGCGNNSDSPVACQTGGCAMLGQAMLECHCTDGEHGEIANQIV